MLLLSKNRENDKNVYLKFWSFFMGQVSLQEKERALNNAVASVEMEGYKMPLFSFKSIT